ncbi:single-stranded DNA-binding protein [Staphylococcus cohnii]|uniref:single-stranded DNA-binding protein n=1 Tax=Staphylococcus cohnii TaxID=29382 RepID=UPI003AF91086
MDFNKVIITGYVASEHKIKEVEGKKQDQEVLNNIVLVNGSNNQTTPIKIAAWNQKAKILKENTVKGSHIMLEGEWKVNQYEKDGRKNFDNYLNVETIQFMESKDELERKKQKLDTQRDPFGNIASGKDTIHQMSEFDIDDLPF